MGSSPLSGIPPSARVDACLAQRPNTTEDPTNQRESGEPMKRPVHPFTHTFIASADLMHSPPKMPRRNANRVGARQVPRISAEEETGPAMLHGGGRRTAAVRDIG